MGWRFASAIRTCVMFQFQYTTCGNCQHTQEFYGPRVPPCPRCGYPELKTHAEYYRSMGVKALACCAALALAGCAALPNSVRPEFEHISHASQHEPFTDHPTRYGANVANLVLHWDLPKHITLELAEGVDLDRHYVSSDSCGEIIGPREQFTGRVAYSFTIH
jgi:hypothetical protein